MDEKLEKSKSLPWFGVPALSPFMRPYALKIALMIFLGVLSSLIDSIYPLINKYILDNNIKNKTLDTLPIVIIIYIGILAFQTWDNYYTMRICSSMELWMDRDLRNKAFDHLQTLSFSYFNQNNVGYIHARVMSDTGKIGELVSWRFMDIVWNLSYIVFIFVVMYIHNIRLALYATIFIPIAVAIILILQKKLVLYNRRMRELNSKLTGDFNEAITGVRSIKVLAAEEKMMESFGKDTKDMYRATVKTAHQSAFLNSSVTFLSGLILAVVLMSGGKLTAGGVIEIGTLSVFLSYALGILEPIQNIINSISALITIQVNIERLMNLLNTKSDVADLPEVIEKYGDTFNPKRENWEELHGDVEFENVSFKYPDGDELVLENFSLKVPQGNSVAIVGETGAGKSTLVNLVCRFFEPTKGRVLIDGRDARERSQLWLHSHLGYVLQTPHLFTGTVRENLKYGKPEASDEEIWQALKLVKGDVVVNKMDNGLDSDVGEGGGMLSTGERQLLSFARAILADPELLVLDEATSSVDTVTERAIQEAIKVVTNGRTSFMIAHRLSTITDADIILAVKDGKIVERGNHRELMDKKGYYYELVKKQNAERF
ncbi:MAG: ABC transporter ATP-binding protein/permease [Lachnospiraceae bacterium]|nr:ABC transporter ATP-binding protein/permease [Lachnospiraceae bacterium]